MDENRKIRFLYPPFVLLISMLIALYYDCDKSLSDFLAQLENADKTTELLIVLIGGGIFVVVLGYLIETMTKLILRLIFWLVKRRHYLVADNLSNETYRSISYMLFLHFRTLNRNQQLNAALTLDNAVLPKGIYQWIIRRWNIFNLACNSIFAIIISLGFLFQFDVSVSRSWLIIIGVMLIILFITAFFAWKETKNMYEFQAECDYNIIQSYRGAN